MRILGCDFASVCTGIHSAHCNAGRFQFNWTQPDAPGEAAKDYAERMLRLPPSRLISGDTRIDHMDAKLLGALQPSEHRAFYRTCNRESMVSKACPKPSRLVHAAEPHSGVYSVHKDKCDLSRRFAGV